MELIMKTKLNFLVAGMFLAATSSALATVRYVNVNNANPTPPYTNWVTAATNIQDAVDAAGAGDEIVVTNGTYAPVSVNTPLTLQSVNGPGVTLIDGGGTVRCVSLTNNAVMVGFTLTDGNAWAGGGVYCESTNAVLTNCVLTGNRAGKAGWGGGAYGGTLNNCTLTGNGAAFGGGASSCTLNHCVLTGNSSSADYDSGILAFGGGGAYDSTLNNCTLTGNNSSNSALGGHGGGAADCTLNNCTLTGNWVHWIPYSYWIPYSFFVPYGGGAADSTLNNCTLTGNWAFGGSGGGAGSEGNQPCTLNNCTVTDNSAGIGGGAYNCTLNNCTLTGNSAYEFEAFGAAGYGGGAISCTLNNCTFTGNSAEGWGGGAHNCTLNNCTLTGNTANGLYVYGQYSPGFGGGAYGDSYQPCTLNNCTLTGNSASDEGGGVYGGTLNNCIVYFNSAPVDGNYDPSRTLNYCCTTPMPTNGLGNITNDPAFVNAAAGDFHLQSDSPCINSGNNAYVVGSTDLDGNSRIVGGTVDIGAYEYQTPASIISYAWLQQYGLPINGSADHADLDGTGMNVYQDWVAGLNPTNALSVLKMLAPVKTNNPTGLVVTWQSVNTRTYYLQRSTNLAAQPAFSTIQSNIVGQAGTTSYTDTTATNAGPYFYRVGVGN
jgi:hypothetical protein